MNFLLKIVEGPNKGAEIALVEGVAVTLGKGDDCDIVLADPTLPDEPATVMAAADGVTFDGSPLASFQVVTRGATSFAVGPGDQPWSELKWPDREGESKETPEKERGEDEGSVRAASSAPTQKNDAEAPSDEKRHRGCLGCLLVFAVFVVVLVLLALLFRDRAKPHAERLWVWTTNTVSGVCARQASDSGKSVAVRAAPALPEIVARHGLFVTNRNARTVLVGDFATRAERLVATAEAYAAKPGVELDFSDDETLKTAAEDTLAMLTEKDLRVAAATNRVVALSGTTRRIRRALEALATDIPKLRNVDVSGVTVVGGVVAAGEEEKTGGTSASDSPRLKTRKAKPAIDLPVCGILMTPYPCLVLRSGTRVLEGASIGDSVVLKIEADAVTVTNATGRFTWKP